MNKKSMALAKMVGGILLLVLLIFFMVYLVKVRVKTGQMVEDSECAAGIIAHSTILKTANEDIAPDIYCPTKYYTIQPKDDAEIQRLLAESMRVCWGTWGRGTIELFKGEGLFCHICSVSDFKANNKRITGFSDYLAKTKIETAQLAGVSYLTYLSSSSNQDLSVVDDKQIAGYAQAVDIDTSQSYATIFMYAKGKGFMKKIFDSYNPLPIGGKTGGAIGGAVFGGGMAISAAAAFCLTGVGCVITIAGVIGAGIGAILGSKAADDIGWVAITVLRPYNADELKKLGCTISPAKQDLEKEKLG